MKIDFGIWESIKGFMDKEEAMRLYDIAFDAADRGPALEIGSYYGKSAYIIGSAAKKRAPFSFRLTITGDQKNSTK